MLYLYRCPVCGHTAEHDSREGPICTGHAQFIQPHLEMPRMRRVYSFGLGRVKGAGDSPGRAS